MLPIFTCTMLRLHGNRPVSVCHLSVFVTQSRSSVETDERIFEIELFWHGSLLRPILHCKKVGYFQK